MIASFEDDLAGLVERNLEKGEEGPANFENMEGNCENFIYQRMKSIMKRTRMR